VSHQGAAPLACSSSLGTALLVVEVSFSSPQIDRGVKVELYARAGAMSMERRD
jgi:hypothetical protein